MPYNKKNAWELYDELQEHLEGTPARIVNASENSADIKLICEALGKAIDALKSVFRPATPG